MERWNFIIIWQLGQLYKARFETAVQVLQLIFYVCMCVVCVCVKVGVERVSVYKQDHRTNNGVENYQKRHNFGLFFRN